MPKILQNVLAWDAANARYQLHSHDANDSAIIPDTPAWPAWLATVASFAFRGQAGAFTARKETKQRGDCYWYAYKSVEKHLVKKYLGKTADVTLERLEAVAAAIHLVPVAVLEVQGDTDPH